MICSTCMPILSFSFHELALSVANNHATNSEKAIHAQMPMIKAHASVFLQMENLISLMTIVLQSHSLTHCAIKNCSGANVKIMVLYCNICTRTSFYHHLLSLPKERTFVKIFPFLLTIALLLHLITKKVIQKIEFEHYYVKNATR